LLQRIPDLVLVGLGMDLEGVFFSRLVGRRALLGDHRANHDLMQSRHYDDPFFFGAAFFWAGFFALFLAAAVLAALALAAGFLALVDFFRGAWASPRFALPPPAPFPA